MKQATFFTSALMASVALASPLAAGKTPAPFSTSITVVTPGEFNDYNGMNIMASNNTLQVGDDAVTAVNCNPRKPTVCPNKGTTFVSISSSTPSSLHLNSMVPKGGQLVYVGTDGRLGFTDPGKQATAGALTSGFFVENGNQLHFATSDNPDTGFFVCMETELLFSVYAGIVSPPSDFCNWVELYESLAPQGYGAYSYA